MTARQVLFRSPALARRPSGRLIDVDGTRRSLGEVAGGTAAECAAVVCCCPCAVLELVVLALYKVPTELCKKAWRKNKRRRKALLLPLTVATTTASPFDEASDLAMVNSRQVEETWPDFYRTGFWRSPDIND